MLLTEYCSNQFALTHIFVFAATIDVMVEVDRSDNTVFILDTEAPIIPGTDKPFTLSVALDISGMIPIKAIVHT